MARFFPRLRGRWSLKSTIRLRLETALERMVEALRGSAGPRRMSSPSSRDRKLPALLRDRDLTTGTVVAEYTFADGFMIVAPSRALLMDALADARQRQFAGAFGGVPVLAAARPERKLLFDRSTRT